MPVNKNMGERGGGPVDTMFVHYSPPRLVEARRWARGGDVERLQRAALGGHGSRLLQLRLAAPGTRAKTFLRTLPGLVERCEALHAAVTDGKLEDLKSILEGDPMRKRLALCRDKAGVGLLHKSVYYDFVEISKYLIDNYQTTIHMRDSEGRTPLHYAAVSSDPAAISSTLISAGAERAPQDIHQRTPTYYTNHLSMLELPLPPPSTPKGGELVIKPSNIRIWCHDRDLGRLQQVVWRGEGARLRTEVSSQPTVRRFLEAVPHIMGTIKDIHASVCENDLAKLKLLTENPIPPVVFSSKDLNGMTPLHKAAGLGHADVAEYILEKYPESVSVTDNDGRTPLHWAALPKDEDRSYNLLLENGAPEGKLDNKMKSAGFYKNRPGDLDKSYLNVVPEAPRIASPSYPSSWDWDLLKSGTQAIRPKKATPPTILEETKSGEDPSPEEAHDASNKGSPEVLSPETPTSELPTESHDEEYHEQFDMEHDYEKEHEYDKQHEYENEHEKEHNFNIDHHEAKDPLEESTTEEMDVAPEEHEEHDEAKDASNSPEPRPKTAASLNPPTPDLKDEHEHANETHASDKEDAAESDHVEEGEEENHADDESEDYKHEESDDDVKHEIDALHVDDENTHHHEPEAVREDLRMREMETKAESADHDDDDVHVRGENDSEYGEVHKAETADVLDVEHLKRKLGSAGARDAEGRQSQGSESTIEGVINADPEVDSLDAEQRDLDNFPNEGNPNLEDDEVQALIDTCNMEQLAGLVLNGEGERLVGQMSQNGELQAFLDNVPSYMNKIKRVHLSARSGGLRELQAALDRRKFAIARDKCSPRGATPLHVAVVFGRTSILRYLAARFPETLSAVDFDGRTALHYAAVLNDNGHYYNILQNMGANPKDQDDEGHTPEDFLKSDKYLTHKELLKDFGADEATTDEMLSDKVSNDKWSARRDLNDGETLAILDRCFHLLQETRQQSAKRPPPSASGNQGPASSFLGRFLPRNVFDRVKYRITKLDHNLFDVIWPAVKKLPNNKNAIDAVEEDFNGGIVAPDYYAYPVFEEFLLPLIKDLHCINMYSDLPNHPESIFLPLSIKKEDEAADESAYLLINLDLDPPGKYVLAGTIECSRNLDEFELPLNMTVGQLESVERTVTDIILSREFYRIFVMPKSNPDEKVGTYYTMNEVLEQPSEIRAVLAASGLLIPLCDSKEMNDDQRLHGKHWPYGRGVFITNDSNLAIWINVQDHIRVMTCTSHSNAAEIGKAYSNISRAMIHLSQILKYRWDDKLGHLSARPSFLGNSLHFNLTITLPYLSKDPEHLKHLCTVRGLYHRETLSSEIVRIGNYQSLGLTELQTFHDYTTAVANILQLEKDLAMQNSMHIAEMFVNIFRKKRSSLVDANY